MPVKEEIGISSRRCFLPVRSAEREDSRRLDQLKGESQQMLGGIGSEESPPGGSGQAPLSNPLDATCVLGKQSPDERPCDDAFLSAGRSQRLPLTTLDKTAILHN